MHATVDPNLTFEQCMLLAVDPNLTFIQKSYNVDHPPLPPSSDAAPRGVGRVALYHVGRHEVLPREQAVLETVRERSGL